MTPHSQALPPPQAGPRVWRGRELAACPESWTHTWSGEEVREIEAAADAFLHSGDSLVELDRARFPLPGVGARLRAVTEELIRGRGFVLLRGLPVADWPEHKRAAAFYGLGAHVGHARSQNAAGHLLGHVVDLGMDGADPGVRIYQTSERQTFHTDSCDVVGLLCINRAKSGGRSLLVSAGAIFNALREHDPGLARLLMQPVATDRRGEVPEGMPPFVLIPVFNWYADCLTVFYQRQYIESAQRFAAAPRLTPAYIAALDRFDALANDPDMHLAMDLEPGDIQLVHNHGLLHDRTGFTDWPEPGRRRRLLRLWLSVPGDRPLPEVFASRFGGVEAGNRGGIITPATRLSVPPAPPVA